MRFMCGDNRVRDYIQTTGRILSARRYNLVAKSKNQAKTAVNKLVMMMICNMVLLLRWGGGVWIHIYLGTTS